MIRLSRKVEYALIAMLHMAKKRNGELTTARELATAYSVSIELIGKILQSLARSNLIISIQGAKGGYQLLQSPDEINIKKIIEVIDGPIRLAKCMENGNSEKCERNQYCTIKKSVKDIQQKLNNLFNQILLKELY